MERGKSRENVGRDCSSLSHTDCEHSSYITNVRRAASVRTPNVLYTVIQVKSWERYAQANSQIHNARYIKELDKNHWGPLKKVHKNTIAMVNIKAKNLKFKKSNFI